jgi:cytosine/adenosine deaminase-related metal-dependent hydrolase
MKIGVTGHRHRAGIDWPWVADALTAELVRLGTVTRAYTSLAEGADQVFAETALQLGIPVTAVIPFTDHANCFAGEALAAYRRLLDRCERLDLASRDPPEQSYLQAGQRVVQAADLLFAVWDGAPAHGIGGTAEIVAYAHRLGRHVCHINPIDRRIERPRTAFG